MKILRFVLRTLTYLLGLAVIAVGINLSKLSHLGISPVSSIPGVLSAKFPAASLGSMVIVVYCLLVLIQFIVLRGKFRIKNVLGVPVAIVFGLLVDFVGISPFSITLAGFSVGIPGKFNGLMQNIPVPTSYPIQFCYLIVSILVIGIGVFIYLKPKLVPMPAEGLAAAIADISGHPFGNCKTLVDVSMISIALLLQLLMFGGFASFASPGVVREGTILSAVCVGQVVKLLNRIFKKK